MGVDCSGFISSAYQLGKKYSTTQLGSSTSPFKVTSWANFQTGDIGNKSGVHVWMNAGPKYNSYNELIGFDTREATTDGSTDKAKTYYRSLSDAQTYTPMILK